MAFLSPVGAQEEPTSVHREQMRQLELEGAPAPSDDAGERLAMEKDGSLFPLKAAGSKAVRAAKPTVDEDFIVFGYAQSYGSAGTYTDFYRWSGLTHIGSTFVSFDSAGAISTANENVWKNRDANLKAGGAAQAAGVKVIMVCLNTGFDVNVINSVMTSSTARAALITEIHNLLANDSYCHGVSFDFEPFSWSSSARAGMVTFFQDLRTSLDTIDPNLEISVYADPSASSTQWDIPGFTPNLDYYLFSCYDYGTGTTAHAISDFNNYVSPFTNFYIDGGVPANKMVAVISTYSGRWSGITAYNTSAGTSRVAGGITDGLYETTLWPEFGGPKTENYVTGDEVSWHTWLDSTTATNYVRTWDSPQALEYKIKAALSNYTSSATNASSGKRLRGVGFWSLLWEAETSSYNMNASDGAVGTIARTRTYPHVYQLCEEILKKPGTTRFLVSGFEGLDFRWRDPNANVDAAGLNAGATRSIVAAPAGAGRPASTTNAMQLHFDFAAAGTQRCFFQYEILADGKGTSIPDMNAVPAIFDANTGINAYIYTPASYAGRTIRMVVADANRQLEMSNAFTLTQSGWRQVFWNLTDPTQTTGFNTGDVRFVDGNGTINTAGGGKKDIAFIGFIVEGAGAAGAGDVVIDELSYEHVNPGDLNYKINEFRYNNAAAEFVEIQGPPGAFPAGTELRFYSAANGSVLSSVSLAGQTMPADGLFVVGDTGVTNVDLVPASWGAADNMVNTNPGSIQLYNTSTGNVYDSVVYLAFGGIRDLARPSTHNVTGESYGWIGEAGSGTANYTMGRYPDGSDTEINEEDFSFMPASPGAPNGDSLALPATLTFDSAPPGAFSSFQTFTVGASGVGASPSGGNVHRCVDTTGGGQMSVIGDAALGAAGAGYTVTGEIFIPNNAAPVQAIGVGICGRQGSNFFTASPLASGYESGYWLIFENAAGAALNDGRADHADTFEFVHATNDNMDGTPVALLGSATRTVTGATAGAWTTFSLSIDPLAAGGGKLIARVNNVDVYNGPIPTGGPISGAFQVGFRENHTGAPAAVEGTWIDNVSITAPGIDTPSPTASPTPSLTASPSVSPTASLTASPTESPTATPTESPSPSPTVLPTDSPTVSPSVSPSDTPTASATASPTVSPSDTPTASATASPSASATASPTASLTASPSATASPSPSPTASPTASLTASPTAAPTASQTASPSPTAAPTASPTAAPTASSTASPSPSATASSTASPTTSPSPSPSASPTATPAPIPGDITHDGTVSAHDLWLLQQHLAAGANLAGAELASADANEDGRVDAADLTAIRSGMLTTVSDEISTAGGNVTLDGYTVTITAGAYTEPVNVTIVLPAPPESVIASRPPVVYTTVEDLSGNVPDFAGVKRGSQARFQIGLPVSTAGSNATYALAVVDESNNETELETGPFADLTAGLVPVTDALYQAALDAGVAPKKWTAGVQTPLSGAR